MPNIFIDACDSDEAVELVVAYREKAEHSKIQVVSDVRAITRFLASKDAGGGLKLSPGKSYVTKADDEVEVPAKIVISLK